MHTINSLFKSQRLYENIMTWGSDDFNATSIIGDYLYVVHTAFIQPLFNSREYIEDYEDEITINIKVMRAYNA